MNIQTARLAYRHLHILHMRQRVPRGWERFARPLLATAAASETYSPLFVALFFFCRLAQYQRQRAPRLALPPSFPNSPLGVLASPSLPPLHPEAAWRLLASAEESIGNKYRLLREVCQASREWHALRTTKALRRATISQTIKELFEEETCSGVATKESAKKFRKEWKPYLEKYTSNGFGYMNPFLRGQREKDSTIWNVEEEIHGACQALRYLQREKKKAFAGEVYRGESGVRPALARLRPGMIFVDEAFLSTSKAESVCRTFMKSGNAVHITLTSRTGVDVKRFSKHSKEDEILFLPGTRFLVDHVEQTEQVLFLRLRELRYQGK